MKIAYLGPAGSFTEKAVRTFSRNARRIPQLSASDVFRAVERGKAVYGVAALENSVGGSIPETRKYLMSSKFRIVKEVSLPVHHCLAVSKRTGTIQTIAGHPQVFLQCRKYFQKQHPRAKLIRRPSGSFAMREVARKNAPGSAAAGSEDAAKRYGLRILRKRIEDSRHNRTRFVVFTKKTNVEPLQKYRKQIDSIDRKMIHLLAERLRVAIEVGNFKRGCNPPLSVNDPQREKKMIAARKRWKKTPMKSSDVEKLMECLIRLSKSRQ
jgi:prephenate dehydratase